MKLTALILLTALMLSGKAWPQENLQIKTIFGKVTKMDIDGGVITVATGAVTEQAFADAHLDADGLWGELVKHGYIDDNGTIQTPFYALDKYTSLAVPKKFNPKKKLICRIIQKALLDNGMMMFYILNDSNLLQGGHHITSVEIEAGDPVTVQYAVSDKNNIIRLVDNRPYESD
jgi:hypothetical protein